VKLFLEEWILNTTWVNIHTSQSLRRDIGNLTWAMSWLADSQQVLECLSSRSIFFRLDQDNLTRCHHHFQGFALKVVQRLRILELHCLLAQQYVMFFILLFIFTVVIDLHFFQLQLLFSMALILLKYHYSSS
jgi:hypothetical protein